MRISKARLTSQSISLKGPVYDTTVCPVLLRVRNIYRLVVFAANGLRIGGNNAEVRKLPMSSLYIENTCPALAVWRIV